MEMSHDNDEVPPALLTPSQREFLAGDRESDSGARQMRYRVRERVALSLGDLGLVFGALVNDESPLHRNDVEYLFEETDPEPVEEAMELLLLLRQRAVDEDVASSQMTGMEERLETLEDRLDRTDALLSQLTDALTEFDP